tara:strand:- start:1089 stop:1616 length:528 start_codon:yes stop_codon:yes gene_type:complete
MASAWAGLTAAQKAKVRKQISSRVTAKGAMRGAVARRTGQKVGQTAKYKGKTVGKVGGVGLAVGGAGSKLSPLEKKYAKSIQTSAAGKKARQTAYAASVKKGFKTAETSAAKTKIPTGTKPGAMKTGSSRDTARAWRQNQVAALQRKKKAGKISTAEFVGMRDKVIRRHKKLIGA